MSESISIIGRGIAGLAIAYRFAKAGFNVNLLGPANLEGSASHVAMGISTVKGDRVARAPLFAAKLLGHRNLKAWVKEVEADSGLKVESSFAGLVEPYLSEADGEALVARLGQDEFVKPFLPVRWEKSRIKKEFSVNGAVDNPVCGALFYPDGAWIDLPSFLSALEAAVLTFGGNVVDNKVSRIFSDDSQLCIELDGKIIRSHHAVIAAGAFSSEILASSGFSDYKLIRHPGQNLMVSVDKSDQLIGTKRRRNFIIRKNELKYGATSIKSENFCEDQKKEGISQLKKEVEEIFGRMDPDCPMRTEWGYRSRFRDRLPAIGAIKLPKSDRAELLVALGYYKNGVQLADLAGKYLVGKVLKKEDKELSELFNNFSPARFLN